MPAAALADSQYLRGTLRVSKTADKEDAPPPLGNSEETAIDDSPCDTVPEVIQVHEDPQEIEASIDAKESKNILTGEPSWPQFSQHPSDLMPETAAFIGKTGAVSSD
jgi:hypothetical protein